MLMTKCVSKNIKSNFAHNKTESKIAERATAAIFVLSTSNFFSDNIILNCTQKIFFSFHFVFRLMT